MAAEDDMTTEDLVESEAVNEAVVLKDWTLAFVGQLLTDSQGSMPSEAVPGVVRKYSSVHTCSLRCQSIFYLHKR